MAPHHLSFPLPPKACPGGRRNSALSLAIMWHRCDQEEEPGGKLGAGGPPMSHLGRPASPLRPLHVSPWGQSASSSLLPLWGCL